MSRKDVDFMEYEEDYTKKPKVVVKKKGGFWGKFFTLILGFVLGVVGTVGGVAGAGYYIAKNKTVGEVLEKAKVPYDTYSQYLSDEYSQMIVWDAIGALAETAQGLDENVTFADLNEISPYVGTQVDLVVSTMKEAYGIDLNVNGDLMDIPVATLNEHLTYCIKNTPLGDMLSKFGSGDMNQIVSALCYGEDGDTPITIADFAGEGLTSRLYALPVDLLMTIPTNDSTLCALAYGAAHRYDVDESTGKAYMLPMYYAYDGVSLFNDLGEKVEGTLVEADGMTDTYILTLPAAEGEEAETQLLQKGEDGNYYAYEYTQTDGAIVKGEAIVFPKTTVGDLQGDAAALIERIQLKDALSVTHASHPVLVALCYGEEGVDFSYAYDETTGKKTGIVEYTTPRTIGYFKAHSKDILDTLYLTDIISPSKDNKMVMYLLYGKEGIHYTYNETTGKYESLQKRVAVDGTAVYNEYGEVVADATANGTASYTVDGVTYTLTPIQNATVNVRVKTDETVQTKTLQAYHVSDEAGNAVKYVRTQLKDLSQANAPLLHNLTGRLTLGDVLTVKEGDTLLINLKDVVIDDLAQAVKELTVLQVFGGENGSIQYLTFEETDIVDGSYTTRNGNVFSTLSDENGTYYLYDEEENSERVYVGDYVDWNGAPVEGENRVLTKIWWYLLHDYESASPTATVDCPLLEFEKLADNMTHNMKIVTLNQLNADGIVEAGVGVRTKALVKEILVGDEEVYTYDEEGNIKTEFVNNTFRPVLNKDALLYPYYEKVVYDGERVELGELTIPQMMHYLEVAVDEYNALLAKNQAENA